VFDCLIILIRRHVGLHRRYWCYHETEYCYEYSIVVCNLFL